MRRAFTAGAATLAALLLLGINSRAQEPSQESLESKKKKLSDLEATLIEGKKMSAEIETQLKSLAEKQASLKVNQALLKKSIEDLERQSNELRTDIPKEEEELAFLNSPPRKVIAVKAADAYLIDFDGTRREVKLHGLYIDPMKSAAITRSLKKRLVKKEVYFRCADVACEKGYLYFNKTGASLNAGLIQARFAVPSDDSKYDVAAFLEGSIHWTTVTSEEKSRVTPLKQ